MRFCPREHSSRLYHKATILKKFSSALFSMVCEVIKNRSKRLAVYIGMSAHPGSSRLSGIVAVSGTWIKTVCFSAAGGLGLPPPIRQFSGRRHSTPVHVPGYKQRNSSCERGKTGSSSLWCPGPIRPGCRHSNPGGSSPFPQAEIGW